MDLAPPVLSRRLAAILAADAVGYSGLMAVDEVGTHRTTMSLIVEVFLPRIEAYKGETIRHTGDGLLAVFDSVTGAVECALEIQAELAARKAQDDAAQKVDFRIGVNFGDVIVEAADIYGDDVNLAVRLEGLAPPGGVCVSADVYQQVRRNIDAPFTDAGRHRVKNIPDPVHAYIVAPQGVRLGRSAAQSRRITTAAAIFAAAQSTVSSSLNSVATAFVKDFDSRLLRPGRPDRTYLRTAQAAVVVAGLLGIGLAVTMAESRIESAFKTFNTMIGLTAGSLGGLFALGVFTRRASGGGALVGAVAGAGLLILVIREKTNRK